MACGGATANWIPNLRARNIARGLGARRAMPRRATRPSTRSINKGAKKSDPPKSRTPPHELSSLANKPLDTEHRTEKFSKKIRDTPSSAL